MAKSMSKRFTMTEKWRNLWFRDELSTESKLFFLYICDNCDMAGFWKIDFRGAAFEIGIKTEALEKILKEFGDRVKCEDGILWIPSFIKKQGNFPINTKNPCHKAIIKSLLEHKPLFSKTLDIYLTKELQSTFDAPSMGLDSPLSNSKSNSNSNGNGNGNGNTGIVKKKNIMSAKYADDTIEFRLSKYLFERIQNRKPDYKQPNLQEWAVQIDRIIRVDKRTPEKIKAVIEWCQADNFWQNNILSTAKLRDKFDQLELKMTSSFTPAPMAGEREAAPLPDDYWPNKEDDKTAVNMFCDSVSPELAGQLRDLLDRGYKTKGEDEKAKFWEEYFKSEAGILWMAWNEKRPQVDLHQWKDIEPTDEQKAYDD